MKRKKRSKKGIESLNKQIKIHELKLEEARKKGLEELETYFEKELARLKAYKEKKKEILEK